MLEKLHQNFHQSRVFLCSQNHFSLYPAGDFRVFVPRSFCGSVTEPAFCRTGFSQGAFSLSLCITSHCSGIHLGFAARSFFRNPQYHARENRFSLRTPQPLWSAIGDVESIWFRSAVPISPFDCDRLWILALFPARLSFYQELMLQPRPEFPHSLLDAKPLPPFHAKPFLHQSSQNVRVDR